MFDTDSLADHIDLVETVAAAGVDPPEEWRALHTRLRSFLDLDHSDEIPLRTQLADAIIGGAAANIPMLRALALAEVANGQQVLTITGHVRNAVHAKMVELYDPVAAYAAVAEKFNKIASDFTAAAAIADPEMAAAAMIVTPDKTRRAWLSSESYANQLSRLLDPLAAAASLAGIPNTDTDAVRLPLVADLSGCHRRRAWEAYIVTDANNDGRASRWGRLARAGAVLRACPLDEHQRYAEPKPMETREEQIRDADGRVVASRRVPFDPEDGVVEPIDPRRPGKTSSIFV